MRAGARKNAASSPRYSASTPASITRGADFAKALAAACPSGIDVYFENVGGAVQQAVWPLLNDFARVPVCGLIAQYNATAPTPGPEMFSLVRKRLTLRGFIVLDFAARQADFLREAGEWVRGGRLKYREDVVEGLENAPAATSPRHAGRQELSARCWSR